MSRIECWSLIPLCMARTLSPPSVSCYSQFLKTAQYGEVRYFDQLSMDQQKVSSPNLAEKDCIKFMTRDQNVILCKYLGCPLHWTQDTLN